LISVWNAIQPITQRQNGLTSGVVDMANLPNVTTDGDVTKSERKNQLRTMTYNYFIRFVGDQNIFKKTFNIVYLCAVELK
jgi:hypothetical protein